MIKSRYMAIAGTALVLVTAFGACKGRTADNMEPLGETVEVVIPMPAEASGEKVSVSVDSLHSGSSMSEESLTDDMSM